MFKLKALNILNLIILLLIGLGLFFVGNVDTLAQDAVKQGYLVRRNNDIPFSAEKIREYDCTEYSDRTDSQSKVYLCSNTSVPNRLGNTIYYQPPGCTNSSCTVGSDTYESCLNLANDLNDPSQPIFFCTKKTNSEGQTTQFFTDNNIRCKVNVSNVNSDTEPYSMDYTLDDCQTTSGEAAPNNECIAWVNKSGTTGFGCPGGSRSRALIPRDSSEESGSILAIYDGGGCWAFRTQNGSDCVSDAELKYVCGNGFFDDRNNETIGAITDTYLCENIASLNVLRDATGTDGQTKYFENALAYSASLEDAGGSNNLSDDCQKQIDANKDAETGTEITCNNGSTTLTKTEDGNWSSGTGGLYDSSGNRVNSTTTSGAGIDDPNAISKIIEFLWKVVAIVLGVSFYIMNIVLLFCLFLATWILLWLLGVNPADSEYINAAIEPWSAIVAIGNLLILASFIYVGFGYLFNIESMRKNLSDFLMKIVYYAILLNFTLFGTATVVNIGYSAGRLIQNIYAGGTSQAKVNEAIAGNIVGAIGRISLYRCEATAKTDGRANINECSLDSKDNDSFFGLGDEVESGEEGSAVGTTIDGTTDTLSGGKTLFGNITQAWHSSETATIWAAAELFVIAAVFIALLVMYKALLLVLFRFITLYLLMILSPLGLASFLAPVEQFQSLGKQMFSRFWKLVIFFPAFSLSLVLINIMVRAFGENILSPDQISLDGNNGFAAAFNIIIKIGLQAAFSIGALYLVVDYFHKQFEEDLKKVGSGLQKLNRAAYIGGLPARLAGKVGKKGLGWAGKNIKLNKTTTLSEGLKNADKFTRGIPAVGEAYGALAATTSLTTKFATDAMTGRLGYSLADMGNTAKRVYDGYINLGKRDIEHSRGINETNLSKALRNVPFGIVSSALDVTDDPLRGFKNQEINDPEFFGKKQQIYAETLRDKVFDATRTLTPDDVNFLLRGMLREPKNLNIEVLSDVLNQALERGDEDTIAKVVGTAKLDKTDKIQNAIYDIVANRLTDKAATASKKYKSLSINNDRIKSAAQDDAYNIRDNKPNVADLNNETYIKTLLETLKYRIDVLGDKRAEADLATVQGIIESSGVQSMLNILNDITNETEKDIAFSPEVVEALLDSESGLVTYDPFEGGRKQFNKQQAYYKGYHKGNYTEETIKAIGNAKNHAQLLSAINSIGDSALNSLNSELKDPSRFGNDPKYFGSVKAAIQKSAQQSLKDNESKSRSQALTLKLRMETLNNIAASYSPGSGARIADIEKQKIGLDNLALGIEKVFETQLSQQGVDLDNAKYVAKDALIAIKESLDNGHEIDSADTRDKVKKVIEKQVKAKTGSTLNATQLDSVVDSVLAKNKATDYKKRAQNASDRFFQDLDTNKAGNIEAAISEIASQAASAKSSYIQKNSKVSPR